MISAIYENNTAAVEVGNEVRSWSRIKSGVKQCYILFPFNWMIMMDLVLKSTRKAMGEHRIKWGRKITRTYADDFSTLDENVSKMNELLDVLQV